jgi:hypothetical protein
MELLITRCLRRYLNKKSTNISADDFEPQTNVPKLYLTSLGLFGKGFLQLGETATAPVNKWQPIFFILPLSRFLERKESWQLLSPKYPAGARATQKTLLFFALPPRRALLHTEHCHPGCE